MWSPSKWGLVLSYILIILSGFYYPRWQKEATEATLSWDVSGYYFYLPAFCIYKDAKELKFGPEIIDKYRPSPQMDQAFKHDSGNFVMKYPVGLAIQYYPWFYIGHFWAKNSFYPADGFSRPYQLSIHWGSILIAFLGLWFLRLILLKYYSERVAAIVILCFCFGTNYLNYAGIDSAMPHNYLFTLYAVLIWLSIKFYERPNFEKAIFIGALVGLATITRPTELLTALIPLLWGAKTINSRIKFWIVHWRYKLAAALSFILVLSIQLTYWKYISGDWLVYSYQDQGFSWLRPHITEGLFSFNSGWLVYTPMMVFALLGFIPLYAKNKSNFRICFAYCLLFLYVTFAWDIWWYGGGLGQRAIIQAFPLFAFPFAEFVRFSLKKPWRYLFFAMFASFFISYNFWLTHQAHRGSLLKPGQMTNRYFWHIFGKNEAHPEASKLLDRAKIFTGEADFRSALWAENFEKNTSTNCSAVIEGQKSICLSGNQQFSEEFVFQSKDIKADWLRVQAKFLTRDKEWEYWKMTQMIVRFKMNDEIIRENMIRIQRQLTQNKIELVHLDAEVPDEFYNKISILFWNASSQKQIIIDELQAIPFNEKKG
jgi:hypothetical protein